MNPIEKPPAIHYFHRTGLLSAFILLALLANACSGLPFGLFATPTPGSEAAPASEGPQPTQQPHAQVSFRVTIPTNSPETESITLNILEEVTGLALSATPYEMDIEDETHFVVTLPFPVGSVLKYRYSRPGSPAVEEHISDGRQVRYRLYHVTGPGIVEDVVSRWTDTPFESPTGRISGAALDAANSQPLPGLLVAAGGAQAITASDGSFLLEGLPPGIHNLVAYSIDGAYKTFQQGAKVDADSTTPASLQLAAAPLVNLIFTVSLPENTIPAVPIRIAGNLYQLGNTFADLSGGISTVANRMPALSTLPDGRMTLTLALPAGADLHYTYTLGDGLWNTEQTAAGALRIRQMIVPEGNTVVEDRVETWNASSAGPVTFDVTVPENTPAGDSVSIQFNPLFGWTNPIPMWKLSPTRWAYVLNSPLNFANNLQVRFCRNEQCGAADDVQTMGLASPGLSVSAGSAPQKVDVTIQNWAWLGNEAAVPPVAPEVQARGETFLAGVEAQPLWNPTWKAHIPAALDEIKGSGANWLLLTPTWTYTRGNPPVLEPVTAYDPTWLELTDEIRLAQERGLNVALFPTPRFPADTASWWQSGTRDFSWWVVWFDRYRNFLLHHADLAARSGAQALIIGGDWLSPALPGGLVADGSPSGAPEDTEFRWRQLIAEIRARYPGTLIWTMSDTQAAGNPPPFLDTVDDVYVLWSSPLAVNGDASPEVMRVEAARQLDTLLMPLQTSLNKPVILGLNVPSAVGSAMNCIPDGGGGCLRDDLLVRPNPDLPQVIVDLDIQASIYEAMLSAVSQRPWISGLVSRGYYSPAALQDKSASVHGKPAQALLAAWFSQIAAAP